MRTENEISSRQLRRRIQSQKKNIINALFPDNTLPVTSGNAFTKVVTDTSNNKIQTIVFKIEVHFHYIILMIK